MDNKKPHRSLSYYVFLVLVMLTIESMFFSGPEIKEISYSQFLDRIYGDQIKSVVINGNKIFGVMKPPGKTKHKKDNAEKKKPISLPYSLPSKHTPWRFNLSYLTIKLKNLKQKQVEEEKQAIALQKRHFSVSALHNPGLIKLLHQHNVEFAARIESHWLQNFLLNWIVPFVILAFLWNIVSRRMGRPPGGALQIGQSKAKIYQEDPNNLIRFKNVAGIDEAIEETREIVAFLKAPERFTRLGANLPKGALLVGPPGTGKTLLAKALAGESGVPFFSLSGSDFIEMFVGVGASRVRDLFKAAKGKAPCIIFIDELDAIGKSRASQGPAVTGFDERENTLNQLLVEMDGFDGRAGVILIAATNRPEVLDPALLRPGRFDRQILVGRPHKEGRKQIFLVHSQKLILADDIDFSALATETAGLVGADIANLCNESALLAARCNREKITQADFQEAFERTVAGLEKKGQVLNEKDRKTVAYHESGHTLIGHFTVGADPVQKVSIVPRGLGTLGYTLQTPAEDRFLMSKSELFGRIRTLLGGRAAEEVVFGEISTGASDDLEKASQLIREMLTVYGMSDRLPNLSLVQQQPSGFLGQTDQSAAHSGEIEQLVGQEHLEILETRYNEAKALIRQHREKLETLAQTLLVNEKIDSKDVNEILGPRPDQNTDSDQNN